MNNCSFVGRLTRDPELRTTQAGKQICTFAIAVDNPFKKNDRGEKGADFFNVTVWGDRADAASRYLVKGQLVTISGRIEVRQYEDRDGNKRTSVDVVANDWRGYTKPGSARDQDDTGGYQQQRTYQGQGQGRSQQQHYQQQPAQDQDLEGDLPF